MHASYRVLFEDIYPETETPLYDQISYDLAPDHLKQYQKLVDNHLLEFEDGRMIDATSVSRLFHALGQVPCNYEHFMGKGGTSEALTLLEQKFDELGGKKIVVFAEYKMTMNLIVERLGSRTKVVTINGDTSEAQKGLNIRAFIEDPGVGVVVIHRKSGGAGLDGLQHVCHHMMFLEPIRSPRDFSQCVARLKRTGQTKRVVVWLPTATDTLQVAAVETLLHNDETVNKVVRSIADLRKLLRGG
jgi:SNF2 family DNA or RNA helicase